MVISYCFYKLSFSNQFWLNILSCYLKNVIQNRKSYTRYLCKFSTGVKSMKFQILVIRYSITVFKTSRFVIIWVMSVHKKMFRNIWHQLCNPIKNKIILTWVLFIRYRPIRKLLFSFFFNFIQKKQVFTKYYPSYTWLFWNWYSYKNMSSSFGCHFCFLFDLSLKFQSNP